MQFKLESAQIYIPDELSAENALARTTHLAIGAHQDDLEIMAIDGILQCFQRNNKWFTGVVLTNGSSSPRDSLYKDYSDGEMRAIRIREQKKAALVGEYAAQILLDYPSAVVKDGADKRPVEDLALILEASQPEIVYTHNLADKHDTHVGVALRTISAIRSLPKNQRPGRLYGCEVWRSLDWLLDEDKTVFEVSAHENLQTALLGIFDSQICGGKRYDLATIGRRLANATFFASHGVDVSTGIVFGMDLSPLIEDPDRDVWDYLHKYIARFTNDVRQRLALVS